MAEPVSTDRDGLIEEVLTQEQQGKLTPASVVLAFEDGNNRFVAGEVTIRNHLALLSDRRRLSDLAGIIGGRQVHPLLSLPRRFRVHERRRTDLADDPSVYIKHLYGPLFFGFTSGFRALTDSLPADAKTLVIRMERVPSIDQSDLYTLEDTILQLIKAGKTVALPGLQTQPDDMLHRIGIVPNLVPEDLVLETFVDFRKRRSSSDED